MALKTYISTYKEKLRTQEGIFYEKNIYYLLKIIKCDYFPLK